MANLNKTLCNCEGFYNEETELCDPLLPNSPDPCPDTFWGNLLGWVTTNVHIGGTPNPTNTGLQYNPYVKKDNTIWYIIGGVAIVAIIFFATKGKKK